MPSESVAHEQIRIHRDQRGSVFEPASPDEFAGFRNAHVVLSAPGAVRGNHRHHRGTEVLAVQGPALVRYQLGEELIDVVIPADEVHRFRIPPGVAHAIQYTGAGLGLSVAFNTEEHDPARPDVERVVLIPVEGK